MIIQVDLGKLIPNGNCVYEDNLQLARERWSRRDFNNGSWLEVVNLDSSWKFNYEGKYFLPDGNHRVYVTYFELGIKEARVTLKNPRDLLYRAGWNLEAFMKCRKELAASGINSIQDLRRKIKPGNWRTANLPSYFTPQMKLENASTF